MLSTSALRFLKETAEAANTPILRALSGVVLLILETAELATQNRKSCRTLCEQIFELVLTVSNELQDTSDDLPDELLLCLDELQDKLVVILTFIQEHLHRRGISQFVNSNRNAVALAAYREDVRRCLEVFQLQAQVLMHKALNEEQSRKDDWAAAFPPEINVPVHRLRSSSSSPRSPDSPAPPSYNEAIGSANQKPRAETLPHRPYIFFGRANELNEIVDCVLKSASTSAARIAILGPGGIGKSALAVSVLHDPAIMADGFRRFFVACDAAESANSLLSVLASAFRITADNPTAIRTQLIRHLSVAKTLLVLDNFESPWEDANGRADVEALLATIAAIPSLTLLVTLRGIERPTGIDWARPFLPPLEPLEAGAARQTFLAIANGSDDDPDIDALLDVVERMPLGVTLMSNLAQYETPGSLLSRWNDEQTSMLDRGGAERHSNLDVSIRLSIDGPRMRSVPDAAQMLYVLSLLPDGLERGLVLDLTRCLDQPARCLSVLLQTSLAYRDTGTHIRVLSPIRSFVLKHLHTCASPTLLSPLYEHYVALAQLSGQLGTAATREYIATLIPEVGNMESVLAHALTNKTSGWQERAAKAAAQTINMTKFTGLGDPAPILELSINAMQVGDDKLVQADCMLALAMLSAVTVRPDFPVEGLVANASQLYQEVNNIEGQIDCLKRNWQMIAAPDASTMLQALSMAEEIGDVLRQGQCHLELGQRFQTQEDFPNARRHFTIAKQLLVDVDEHWLRARCAYSLGNIAASTGHSATAMRYYTEALTLMESIDSRSGVSHCYSYMGWVYRRLGDAPSAIAHTRQAVEGYQQTGFVMDQTLALVQLTQSFVDASDTAEARQALEDTQVLLRKTTPKWVYGHAQGAFARGDVAFLEGEDELAIHCYEQAISLFWSRRCFQEAAEVHARASQLRLARNEFDEAYQHAVTGIALALRGKHPGDLAACVNALAEVLLADGEDNAAFAVTRAVLPMLNGLGRMRDIANCFERFAKLALLAGDLGRTRTFCNDALKLYETAGDKGGIQRCRTLLEAL
ncbi:TPR-like protein [Exidia glandulosa HHB12029]|uniref:TPR-like protein n=1 Tax=Exidia glandulosa HHB12029 TaxID=1314781 RepID=A0A165I4H2_EXIGL|nr:TPR-like protein [Exidia glandulosa HHB12029]